MTSPRKNGHSRKVDNSLPVATVAIVEWSKRAQKSNKIVTASITNQLILDVAG
jgi:hypothetical protein